MVSCHFLLFTFVLGQLSFLSLYFWFHRQFSLLNCVWMLFCPFVLWFCKLSFLFLSFSFSISFSLFLVSSIVICHFSCVWLFVISIFFLFNCLVITLLSTGTGIWNPGSAEHSQQHECSWQCHSHTSSSTWCCFTAATTRSHQPSLEGTLYRGLWQAEVLQQVRFTCYDIFC